MPLPSHTLRVPDGQVPSASSHPDDPPPATAPGRSQDAHQRWWTRQDGALLNAGAAAQQRATSAGRIPQAVSPKRAHQTARLRSGISPASRADWASIRVPSSTYDHNRRRPWNSTRPDPIPVSTTTLPSLPTGISANGQSGHNHFQIAHLCTNEKSVPLDAHRQNSVEWT